MIIPISYYIACGFRSKMSCEETFSFYDWKEDDVLNIVKRSDPNATRDVFKELKSMLISIMHAMNIIQMSGKLT